MKSFSKTIRVSPEHLDWNSHVNNITYLQWAVDLSREHWLSEVSEEIANNNFWVVRSHHIEYKKQAFLGDELQIKTFVESVKGPLSERIVEIRRDETLIAEVNSSWCFIDLVTQKLKRVPEDIQELFF
ncbi:MAG: acyl-CoA thioesterase [Ekhidna sp.]